MAARAQPAVAAMVARQVASCRSVSAAAGPTTRLLIFNPGAGGIDSAVQAKLRKAFPTYRTLNIDEHKNFQRNLSPHATVVVAGGDGTIGRVARALAGTRRRLGLLPLGTYNNFARALGIPVRLERAIEVVHAGRVTGVTLGRINGRPFLEAAALGVFGEMIVMGEHAKELEFGHVGKQLQEIAGAERFEYTMSGDLEGSGEALSLVFTNTPTTGTRMAVGHKTPVQPFLELSMHVGESRTDIVSRVLASALLDKHAQRDGMSFHFLRIAVRTRPRIRAFADNKPWGRSPVTVASDPDALRVFVP